MQFATHEHNLTDSKESKEWCKTTTTIATTNVLQLYFYLMGIGNLHYDTEFKYHQQKPLLALWIARGL